MAYKSKDKQRIQHIRYYREHKQQIGKQKTEYYRKNKETILQHEKNYYREHNQQELKRARKYYYKNKKDRLQAAKARSLQKLLNKFGLTMDKYNRMFEEQQGCCAICGKHQSELKYALGIDHNHITGQIRGLLCKSCNLGIGSLRGDFGVEVLQGAVIYIKKQEK